MGKNTIEVELHEDDGDKIIFKTDDWDVIRVLDEQDVIKCRIDNCDDGIVVGLADKNDLLDLEE